VETLKAAVCEHKIPTYTCDECRYEVGVVKVPGEMFDAAEGGALQTVKAGTRILSAGKDLNAEIRLNEERAVFVGPVTAGTVRAIRVDLGGRVAKGKSSTRWTARIPPSQIDHTRAASAMELARATEQREAELFSKGICPKRDLLEAQASSAWRRRSTGRSRCAAEHGTFGRGAGFPGLRCGRFGPHARTGAVFGDRPRSLAQPGSPRAAWRPGAPLADTSIVWVQTTLYESELTAVLGAPAGVPVEAEIRVAGYRSASFEEPSRRSGNAGRVHAHGHGEGCGGEPDNLLRAGDVREGPPRAHGWRKPGAAEEAILEDEGRAFAFKHLEGLYYIRRPLELGRKDGGGSKCSRGSRRATPSSPKGPSS